MIVDSAEWGILWPAFIAGVLVTATHVPLGMQVLDRGIVFLDLAIAQVAAFGVILADYLGWSPTGIAVQVAALSAALVCAALLTWTDNRWPQVQEAIIGVVFVMASSAAILVLAKNPHGSENLKDLLSGQILWVHPARLPYDALFYAVILALWFGFRERLGRIGFYVLLCNWSGCSSFSPRWCCRHSPPSIRATGACSRRMRWACWDTQQASWYRSSPICHRGR